MQPNFPISSKTANAGPSPPPPASHEAALGTHPIIVEALAHESTNNVHAYSIADDTNLAGTPEQTTAAALRLQQLLHSKADLHVKK